MMISGLIRQLRSKYADHPKAAQVTRTGDGSSTLYNLGRDRVPIMENSYSVYKGTSAQSETANYLLDKDTGDLQFLVAPTSAYATRVNFKHANFRDADWMAAINDGIDKLNARGFYRQIVRDTSSFFLSAGKQVYDAPAGARDVYEMFLNDGSGNYSQPFTNWSYQQDGNKIVLGAKPTARTSAAISYTRRLQRYTAISATVDVRDEWLELVEKNAGSYYFAGRASRIAQTGNASVQEGHFSFTSLRTQSRDLYAEFDVEARRMKPTAAAKDIHYQIPTGGKA